MNIIGLMPVRNEDWVLGLSARAALMWLDHLIILDHASVDRTFDVIEELMHEIPGRVTWLRERDAEWEEMRHRQRLLENARARKATHVALIDADEVLTGNLLPRIRAWIGETPAGVCFQLPMFCMRDSLEEAHSSGVWGRAMVSFAFKDDSVWHWSSEERDGYDYHHRHPMGQPFISQAPVPRHVGGVMHLQFVNPRRLRAKQALYKMQEVTRWPERFTAAAINARYDLAVYGGARGETWSLRKVPASFWEPYSLSGINLSEETVPWQETECERLWKVHGQSAFAGLDLFGVTERFKASVALAPAYTPTSAA